jgi:flagellar biosynthesis protein FlhB
MAEDILTIVVYILCLVSFIAIIDAGIAIIQYIEDLPMIRSKIWSRKHKLFQRFKHVYH